MYALIIPASTPFVLLATVLGLSWWEDRILPAPPAGPDPAQLPEPVGLDTGVTREDAGR